MSTGSTRPVFPTKASLDDLGAEYVIAFIVIVVLTVLAIFVVCLGLGYLFCSRKKRSAYNKEDSKELAKDQVISRNLPPKIKDILKGIAPKPATMIPIDKPQEESQTKDNQMSNNRLPKPVNPPPSYQYPMHLLFADENKEKLGDTI